MNIYSKKKRWKWFLFATAIIIIVASLWYTNILVRKFAEDERTNIKIWADAIQRKAKLVNYTDNFFEQIKVEEQKRAEIFAEAYKILGREDTKDNLTFYIEVIKGNTTVPVIITDDKGKITNYINIDLDPDSVKYLKGELKKEFTVYPPITINYYANKNIYLYYKESLLFSELRHVLDDLIESFFSEIVENSASVPVIVTDSTKRHVITYGNIDDQKMADSLFVENTISSMSFENDPIIFELPDQGKTYIFYKDSYLLTQIRYYPFIQFVVIGLFLLIAYFLFSAARKSEQNQVWVGMSKETAHQLGTPLSSMIAWVELLKLKGHKDREITEIEKDINRLENITERFSKIGSPAKPENQNIIKIIYNSVKYIKSRTSKKVKYLITVPEDKEIFAPVNHNLFEWVIENLCKNAVDAMNGVGTLTIDVIEENKYVIIDFTDTGKGIPKSNHKTVFNPGFTSKKRGWGLGLSLSERIIKNYHRGKIFVKSSVIDQGTTFRIVLKKFKVK